VLGFMNCGRVDGGMDEGGRESGLDRVGGGKDYGLEEHQLWPQ
jgi:hypothetical protein